MNHEVKKKKRIGDAPQAYTAQYYDIFFSHDISTRLSYGPDMLPGFYGSQNEKTISKNQQKCFTH